MEGQFVRGAVIKGEENSFFRCLHNIWTPLEPHTGPNLPAVHQTVHVVDLLVGPVPPVVLPQVFDGGDGQDEDDRGQSELRLERVDHRHEVEQRDEDKVNIGESVELLEEVLGQEGEHGVLGGLDLVAGVVSVRVLLPFGVVEQQVGVDEPAFALFGFLLPLPLDFGSLGRPGVLGVPRHNRSSPRRPRRCPASNFPTLEPVVSSHTRKKATQSASYVIIL